MPSAHSTAAWISVAPSVRTGSTSNEIEGCIPADAWHDADRTARGHRGARNPDVHRGTDLSQVPAACTALRGQDCVAAIADGAGEVLPAEQRLHGQGDCGQYGGHAGAWPAGD